MSEDKDLPALPECDSYCTHADSHEYDVFTADQMRAYARASLAQQAGEDARDAARYRAFFDAGLPITFLGEEHSTKAGLDAAIDQAMKGGE